MSTQSRHVSVMTAQVLAYLRADRGGCFLDCTLGGGGHTEAILSAHPEATVEAFDRDTRALERAGSRLAKYESRVKVRHGAFADLAGALDESGEAEPRFDGMLADLGLSTDQLHEVRGFSFSDDGPLDMRMDESQTYRAHDVVNSLEERDLIRVLRRGGLGAEATPIGRGIVRARPIETARALAAVVAGACPQFARKKTIHPATVTFQAIRIEVNGELEQIHALLDLAPRVVRNNGRLVVITFHSLEDKLVVRTMRDWEAGDTTPALQRGAEFKLTRGAQRLDASPLVARARQLAEGGSIGVVLTRHAATPDDQETRDNPSARSARLRAFEFH